MKRKTTSEAGIFTPRAFAAFALCAFAAFLALVTFATTPSSGTISDSNTSVTYTGGPITVPTNSTDSAGGPVTCDSAHPCDDFPLHTDISAAYKTAHPDYVLTIEVSWSDPTSQQDLDIFLVDSVAPDGPYTAHGTNLGDNPEVMKIPISALATGPHDYIVRVVPFVSTSQTYTGKITLAAGPVVGPTPTPPPPFSGIAPRYYNYSPGAGQGENAGEPSIGYNLTTHRAMFLAGLQTLQVTFPEVQSSAGQIPNTRPGSCDATWLDKTFVFTGTRSADPILFTDQTTGRTFVSQLNTVTQTNPVLIGLNSLMAFTDDDGETWTAAQLNLPDGSNDHQTVGAGPYPAALAGLSNDLNKGHAVYYCGQAGYVLAITGSAYCSRSDDGGLNFGKSVIAYTDSVSGCAQSIHGHVKVAPDGTVYLPNSSCNGHPAVAVSTDAGTTWTVKEVPSGISSPAILDPSVAIASDNTVYLFFIGKPDENSDSGHVYATVSKNHGDTWSTPVDIGAGAGVVNAVFPTGIAGDPDRAACAFLGTSTNGDHQAADFKGIWYGYVAHTYDGGQTWVTVNATTNGPVQREACIWNGGGANVCRNLLDFNDITMDEHGMVLFGFADGCVGTCETGGPNSYSSKSTIARQSGGKGLLAQYDPAPAEPLKPQAACLSGRRDDMASYLQWVIPDNGGSPITSYKIYRKDATAGSTEQLVGQPTNGKNSFVDRTADPNVATYLYRITAVNAQGEGLTSNTISLSVGPRIELLGSCGSPGTQVIIDPVGDASTNALNSLPPPIPTVGPSQDITSVSIAEPMSNTTTGVANNIVFTMKMVNMTTIPPGWRWAIRFQVNKGGTLVTPPTDATGGPSEDFFVAMVTSDASTTPTFVWGTTSVPQNAARVFTTKGNLDPSSNVTPDGTITMVLPKSIISNPGPGDSITAMLGSVRLTLPSTAPSTGGTNETIVDSTNGGDSYVLRPINLCLPNTAPIAQLNGDTDEGLPTLTVHFDGTASHDPDTIDSVTTYTFNFDDGQGDVVSNSPLISHAFSQPGEYTVRLVVQDSRGKISSNTAKFIVEVQQPLGAVTAASRKTHNGVAFDIDLPLTGTAGVECRAPGTNGSYNLVYSFNKPVSVPGAASKTQGTATVGVPTLGPAANQVTVPLTGVSNAQHLVITLSGVQNTLGEAANNQTARLDVLLGDVNGNGRVNATDTSIVQSQSGRALSTITFRSDVNASGLINSTDTSIVQSKSGTALP